MDKPHQRDDIYSLSLQAIEGTLSDADFFRLEDYLKSDTSFCEAYVETVLLYSMMRKPGCAFELTALEAGSFDSAAWQAMAEYEDHAPSVKIFREKAVEEPVRPVHPSRGINKWSVYTAIASIAALLFMLLFVHFAPEYESRLVGQLTRTVNAEWASVNGAIKEGDELYAGPMKLVKGMAEIVFYSGAQVIIEGPCVFEIENPNRIFLNSGSMVANIKSSVEKRFVVRTQNASVVDYGTEFGVAIDDFGNTQTRVFQGSVELRQGSDPLKFDAALRLEVGQGGEADVRGTLSRRDINPQQFMRKEQFDVRLLASKGSAYHRWKAYNYDMERDPSLVAHYTFEKNSNREDLLMNMSSYPGDVPDGVLGGESFNSPRWVPGRWPQTTALEFDRANNQAVWVPEHQALDIAGDITLSVWVKPILTDNLYWGGIILSCKNIDDTNGVNYSLAFQNAKEPADLDKQKIRFIRRPSGENVGTGHYESRYVTLEKDRWHLVSVTQNKREIRFFFDGVFVSSEECIYDVAPSPAELIIGNSLMRPGVSEKHHGLIGEVSIFNRALSDSEIQDMYRAGKI